MCAFNSKVVRVSDDRACTSQRARVRKQPPPHVHVHECVCINECNNLAHDMCVCLSVCACELLTFRVENPSRARAPLTLYLFVVYVCIVCECVCCVSVCASLRRQQHTHTHRRHELREPRANTQTIHKHHMCAMCPQKCTDLVYLSFRSLALAAPRRNEPDAYRRPLRRCLPLSGVFRT